MFITFEGIDGSGKTTQARALAATLTEQGYEVLLTREPGGTPIGDQIRAIVVDNLTNTNMTAEAELLLFCASRAQLVGEVIRPFLAQGGIVLCDRYADSTMAYQGYGHGLDLEALRQILRFATGGLTPDLTIYLDLDPRIGLERRRRGRLLMSEDWNRLDDKELAYHQRVYAGYEALIAEQPERWLRLPADHPVETVQAQLLSLLKPRLPAKKRKRPRKTG
jgi:dTMP kinase